jgi:hypothetical protein
VQPAADVIFTNLVEPELAVVVAQSAAFAGGEIIIVKPERIRLNARSPDPIFLDIKNRVRRVRMLPSLGEETLPPSRPACNLC